MMRKSPSSKLIRESIQQIHGYVPGEQPKIPGLIKLNTNENPYPPSPKVLAAIKAATDGRLRLYPNPTAENLRVKLATFHGCTADNIIVGNGSDELLALATRAFVDPATSKGRASRETVQYFSPSYSLYPVLADIHGARKKAVDLLPDFSLPNDKQLKQNGWDFEAALSFITTPNAPSGRGYSTEDLDRLCRKQRGVVILDEAYVDFARDNALELALRHPHVLVARTFSKAYALCFLRVGYFVGHPELIGALHTIRDSYNVNGLGQVAAEATLGDLPYYRKNFRRVIATRERLCSALTGLGFQVYESQTNFVLTIPPRFPAQAWLEKLRAEKLLVRWFSTPAISQFLRISIGTDAEIDRLVAVCKKIAR